MAKLFLRNLVVRDIIKSKMDKIHEVRKSVAAPLMARVVPGPP